LPSDIYAYNAVTSVYKANNSDTLAPLNKLEARERGIMTGYYLIGSKIGLSLMPTTSRINGMRVTYTKKLSSMESASDSPDLPSMCENYLTEFVERKVNAINSSADIGNSNVFTSEERGMIADIFAKNNSDIDYPPITDSTYLIV